MVVLLVFAALTALAAGRSVTILPVDEFGKAVTGCRVDQFSERSLDPATPLDRARNFSDRFEGLVGRNVEGNSFELVVHCADRYRGSGLLWLQREDTLIVLPTSQRVGDNYFGGKPRLTLTVDPPLPGAWIRVTRPYGDYSETAAVDAKTGVANLYNAETGKYVIFLLKPGRMVCIYEYDHKDQGARVRLSGDGSCQVKEVIRPSF